MLVEDDNNLREIYEARLLAEGYEIVSAKDGEEALAMAVKEKPDLIISDVMMPKISGFDMLDILRSTPETKDTKVVMMTALSQAEDKSRADKLGADRYLVKSQVTLEDVAKVAREVLSGEDAATAQPIDQLVAGATQVSTAPAEQPVAVAEPPVAPPAAPEPAPEPAPAAPAPVQPPEPPAEPPIAPPPPADPGAPSEPPAAPPAEPPAPTEPPPTGNTGVIDSNLPLTAASEEAGVNQQIDEFVNQLPSEPPAPLPAEADPTKPEPVDENAIPPLPEGLTLVEPTPEPSAEQAAPAVVTAPMEVEPAPAATEAAPQPTETSTTTIAPTATESATMNATPPPNEMQPVVVEPTVTAPPAAPATNVENLAVPPAGHDPAAAAANAAKLTETVNNMLQSQEQASPQPPAAAPAAPASDGGVNGKKVIQPMHDLTQKPNLAQLAAEEAAPPPVAPPANTMVSPGGSAVTPAAPAEAPDPTHPGNVIHPGDPNAIAL
jgi:CheY-like chemotaxis protein